MIAEYYRHKCAAKYHYYRCASCGRKASRENPIATSQGECRDCLLGMEEDRQNGPPTNIKSNIHWHSRETGDCSSVSHTPAAIPS
jgi:hypothetical protein